MQHTLIQQTIAILFLASPAIFAGIVALAKPRAVLEWGDAFDTWVISTHPTYAGKAGYVKRVFYKPVIWAFKKIVLWTQNIKDDFTRCGVRIACYLYVAAIIFGALAYLAIIAIYIVLTIVIIIAAVFVTLLILGAMLRGGDRQNVYDKHGNLIGTIERD